MKYKLSILTFTLLFCINLCTAQDTATYLSLCGSKFAVPESCEAESKYQLLCEGFSIAWIYMDDEMLQSVPQQTIKRFEQFNEFSSEKIRCKLLDNTIEGVRLSYVNEGKKKYQIFAFGKVNRLPVFFQMVTDKEVRTNKDIPEYVSQMLQLID